jgi:hypothetical protein
MKIPDAPESLDICFLTFFVVLYERVLLQLHEIPPFGRRHEMREALSLLQNGNVRILGIYGAFWALGGLSARASRQS